MYEAQALCKDELNPKDGLAPDGEHLWRSSTAVGSTQVTFRHKVLGEL